MKNMDVLTKEQKEYLLLKSGKDAMYHYFIELVRSNKIPPRCLDHLKETPKQDINFTHEKYFYLFMEILQGKRPEYIDAINEYHRKSNKK
jgi:hypothetical protein